MGPKEFHTAGESQSHRAQGKSQMGLVLVSSVDFMQQKILKHLRGKLGSLYKLMWGKTVQRCAARDSEAYSSLPGTAAFIIFKTIERYQ